LEIEIKQGLLIIVVETGPRDPTSACSGSPSAGFFGKLRAAESAMLHGAKECLWPTQTAAA
jgi:hypothetical protein